MGLSKRHLLQSRRDDGGGLARAPASSEDGLLMTTALGRGVIVLKRAHLPLI